MENKIKHKDLKYEANIYIYIYIFDFQQFEAMRSFGDSIYIGRFSTMR